MLLDLASLGTTFTHLRTCDRLRAADALSRGSVVIYVIGPIVGSIVPLLAPSALRRLHRNHKHYHQIYATPKFHLLSVELPLSAETEQYIWCETWLLSYELLRSTPPGISLRR